MRVDRAFAADPSSPVDHGHHVGRLGEQTLAKNMEGITKVIGSG
jgi:hypothetical protein